MQRSPRRLSARHGVTVSEGLAEAGVALALDIGARRLVALTRTGATSRWQSGSRRTSWRCRSCDALRT
jgi:hypothetical protein